MRLYSVCAVTLVVLDTIIVLACLLLLNFSSGGIFRGLAFVSVSSICMFNKIY